MARKVDEAFTLFVQASSAALLRLAYLLTQDHGHAEDVVQSALLTTYRRWSTIRDADRAHAYAKQVVITTAASRWRLRANQEIVDLPAHGHTTTPGTSDVAGERDAMRRLLQTLPPRMRTVLVLRYFEDLSEVETAAALGCSVHTVRSHTARGLARLRSALSPPPGGSHTPTSTPLPLAARSL